MNICLIGYGRMGHEIEKAGKERGHQFPLIIDEYNAEDLKAESLQDIDVAINFSTPDSAPGQILTCLKAGIPAVSGTTGWNDRMEEIREACIEMKGAFFFASNFSIGVNIFFNVNRHLASLMNRFQEYRPSIKEIHHIHKLDAPSGTAITLAEQIIEAHKNTSVWTLGQNRETEGTLPIEAIREGEVKGYHEIRYTSDIDDITISHTAKNRKGFALGAVLAAEFIRGKSGCFGMNDLLQL
jgi:4-hydroxy-tetrahydrodipicolinate reductase